jgi:hypothetical protein
MSVLEASLMSVPIPPDSALQLPSESVPAFACAKADPLRLQLRSVVSVRWTPLFGQLTGFDKWNLATV